MECKHLKHLTIQIKKCLHYEQLCCGQLVTFLVGTHTIFLLALHVTLTQTLVGYIGGNFAYGTPSFFT